MKRFRRKEISSGWSLEQYGEHSHSFILVVPLNTNLKVITKTLSKISGGSNVFIFNSIYNGVEVFFRSNLSFKQTISKVAELFNFDCEKTGKKRKPRLFTPVKQYTLEGEYIRTWDGIVIAAETLGINPGNISKCAAGKCSQAGGYIWKK